MSKISRCSRCGGNIVEPAYPGDGVYPVSPMCECDATGSKSRWHMTAAEMVPWGSNFGGIADQEEE